MHLLALIGRSNLRFANNYRSSAIKYISGFSANQSTAAATVTGEDPPLTSDKKQAFESAREPSNFISRLLVNFSQSPQGFSCLDDVDEITANAVQTEIWHRRRWYKDAGVDEDRSELLRREFDPEFQNWRRIWKCTLIETIPASTCPEVVFFGRYNSGKSSLLNTLFRKRKKPIVQVSKKRGFHQRLFAFNSGRRPRRTIVDSPGYGYYASLALPSLAENYVLRREELRRVFLLINCQHGLNRVDELMLQFLSDNKVPHQIILSKSDIINTRTRKRRLEEIDSYCRANPTDAFRSPTFIFASAKSGDGIHDVRNAIAEACYEGVPRKLKGSL